MPFYEYECSNCKFYTEVMQRISDAPLRKCPSCGKSALKKLLSAPVFRLKGSGWYETDFKSDKENKRNLAGADKEEAKSETKTDAKTVAKPEAGKSDAAKPEPPKVDAAKPDTKPAADKASTSASKSSARAKPKSRPKRTAKRPARG